MGEWSKDGESRGRGRGIVKLGRRGRGGVGECDAWRIMRRERESVKERMGRRF